MNIIDKIISGIAAFFTLIFGVFNPSQPINDQQTSMPVNALTIQAMRQASYPGSAITIEETLISEKTYNRHIVSYESAGLKNFALLLVPTTAKPQNGYPVIILNHGYIIPEKYTPDGNYIAYADAFAKEGYIVFKPNYRGHGKSEGFPTSSYFAPDYTVDVLNAISSIKNYKDANPGKIGVWGHSMGGSITLRALTVNSKDIKAAAIWGGVVGSYDEIINNWQERVTYKPNTEDLMLRYKNLNVLVGAFGTPEKNPDYWNSVDPSFFVGDITAPVQISVGLMDNQVPPDFSKSLYDKFKSARKVVEYYEYPDSNHDINQSFTLAMKRTIEFFNRYLK